MRGFISLKWSSKTLNHSPSATSFLGEEEQETLIRSPSKTPSGWQRKFRKFRMLDRYFCHKQHHWQSKSETLTKSQILEAAHKAILEQTWTKWPKCKFQSGQRDEEIKTCLHAQTISMFKDEKLEALQSKMNDLLTTSKLGISQRVNVSESKGVITVTTENHPAKTSVLQDPKSTDPQKQLIAKLKWKFKKRKQSQAQG